MAIRFKAEDAAEKGYTKADWDEVSDNPPITEDRMKEAKSFKEALPDLHESIQRSRGRPKKAHPKAAVTLRLDPRVVERFKAGGGDWRARMVEAIEKAG
ncbi:BrnA antitoxin family protein [Pararhizobium mangrovi]|uniref:BrnA antitoxin family protein n=1 Tax=Pararhizobium mangrovi TaxID=2590452 RepID=A0A506TXU8_9HYPH|nr:BrnA antitoxin family protein [Pararhizobium mangrovi]TPW26018.1 BrnA antitoxin family protein [Pararhizobium mangrovi]